MDTQFYINLTMQTDQGSESFGRFNLGNNRERALDIWVRMAGDPNLNLSALLQMEWIEADVTLPLEVRVKGCPLQQVADNCSVITKELFKTRNLG